MKNESAAETDTVIHKVVAAARDGREPRVIARLFSGWAVFGERQFLKGYALLLPDPVVPTLNALSAQGRAAYMQDVARLGDAVLKVTGAARINYAILGNQEPALHTHVIPRYADEPENLRKSHPWAYDWNAAPLFDRATYRELADNLYRELTRLGVTKPMRFQPGANMGAAVASGGKPAGSQPVVGAKPTDAKTVAARPVGTRPGETTPGEVKPAGGKPPKPSS